MCSIMGLTPSGMRYYPGQGEMIAGFWMPNRAWEGCDVDDPSARVLSNYGASGT